LPADRYIPVAPSVLLCPLKEGKKKKKKGEEKYLTTIFVFLLVFRILRLKEAGYRERQAVRNPKTYRVVMAILHKGRGRKGERGSTQWFLIW